jgi:uncharacterized repeat protein (TIGR03837 family)
VDNPFMDRSLQWDIFCKVIDNFGDIGVSWRLSADLAARGHRVRLWVDDASALSWMAPDGAPGVEVLPWAQAEASAAPMGVAPDVLIEAFGCEIPPAFLHTNAARPPLWLNLEYLSAEAYVERCHGLASPVLSGPAAGATKTFFYPGFTPATGGLLREPSLTAQQASFNRAEWLAGHVGGTASNARVVSLFCYEPPLLEALLKQWQANGLNGRPVALLATAGRAAAAVQRAYPALSEGEVQPGSALAVTYLPKLSQTEFDHLLWSSDLNFVRGEDSLVRALWAGKPLIWHLYPQADDAHHAKLEAYLARIEAPESLRAFHRAWNGSAASTLPLISPDDLAHWAEHAAALKSALWQQRDLASSLLQFAAENR